MASGLPVEIPRDPGTKPGVRSQTLISTGLSELDTILGGGLPLGTVLLLLEDEYTQHHRTLLGYFLAEGLACGHQCHWAAAKHSLEGAGAALPQLVVPKPVKDSDRPAREEEEDATSLRIAWQYRRYIKGKQNLDAERQEQPRPTAKSAFQRKRPGGAAVAATGLRSWCHQFDLTKPFDESALAAGQLECSSWQGKDMLSNMPSALRDFACRISLALQPRSLDSLVANEQPKAAAEPSGEAQQGTSAAAGRVASRVKTSFLRKPPAGAGGPNTVCAAEPTSASTAGPSTASSAAVKQSTPVDDSSGPRQASPSLAQPGRQGAATRPQTAPLGPESVGRIAIQSLGAPEWRCLGDERQQEADILRMVWALKSTVRDSRCAAAVSVPAGLFSESFAARLLHMSDAAVSLEAVLDDSALISLIPDPGSCCGVLRVRRLPCLNTLVRPIPAIPLFLIRNRRKRIALQPFEVDPDAEADMASAAGKSPTAGLCGGPPAAAKPFDF